MTDSLTSRAAFREALAKAPLPDLDAVSGAEQRNGHLTKPPGALGRLEDLAVWYAGWRRDPRPVIAAPQVLVFAGNHGVTARGVSAFPAQVTAQMVVNFRAGGAAINQLSQVVGASMQVHALELDRPTADFTEGPAMTEDDLVGALDAGWRAVDPSADLLVTGEMGIGNTTSAAALAHLLYGGTAADWTGRGTGVEGEALAAKTDAVARAGALHAGATGLEALRRVGGRELAAMAGAIGRARVLGIPVILDGYVCTAAAACLATELPGALDHTVAGHVSAEAAHPALLAKLGKEPLLSLGMRLGEGSGAAIAVSILKAAIACHSGMATFDEAGVSGG